ncbi:hypothetical protein CIB84_014596, partial [Bambusicola thoracicus]
PKLEDEEGWKKFCLGERVYSEIDAESDHENLGIDYIKVSIRELIINCGLSSSPKYCKQNESDITLSLYASLLKATVTSVLEYLISWFGEKKFTPELEMPLIKNSLFKSTQGRWFYALLACLEKPLLPEAHSLIRQLARRCSEVRVLEENKNEEQVSALNLLICLVSR